MLLVNADDLGRKRQLTDRILRCYLEKRIHTASAMTFMTDSERAAGLAKENNLRVGLHLNLTENFTGEKVPNSLRDRHRLVATYLKSRKVNQIFCNPFLRNVFDYVFKSQWEEFCQLYG